MTARKRPTDEEFLKFCKDWDTSDHEHKIRMCADFGIAYDTAKHWRSENTIPKRRSVARVPLGQTEHQSMSAGNSLRINTGKDFKTAIIINDTQNPYQDVKAVSLVHSFMAETQPDYVIRLGDMSDFYQISSFSQDPRRKTMLAQDIQNSRDMLAEERRLCPNARFIETIGNHELRWQKYLWSRAPELVDLDCLRYEELFGLAENEVELVPYECGIMMNDTFMFTHGNLASTHSSYTAKRMYEKHGGNGMCAHTHRGGVYYKRNRFGVWGWWENFCLCSLYPDWIENPDWVQGFSLVHFLGKRFFVEQIPILGHAFIYGGKMYE